MTGIELYRNRLGGKAEPSRERWLRNTQNWINKKLPHSLSYHSAIVDGVERKVAILSTQDNAEKKICSMPGEYLECGVYVEWMDNIWLITDLNAPDEVYQTALMTQCNYVLKWINDRGQIIERPVSVIDGTKYLTGEFYQVRGLGITVGDSRMQLTMPRDDETVLLNRGARFLIDDPAATEPQAYELTKINRTGRVFNGHGVFIHMLSECNRNPEKDNFELMIADYYDDDGQPRVVDSHIEDSENEGLTQLVVGRESEQILVASTMKIPISLYVNGVQQDQFAIAYELDCASSVATCYMDENDCLVVTTGKDRKNIGTEFNISIVAALDDESVFVRESCRFVIKGWS